MWSHLWLWDSFSEVCYQPTALPQATTPGLPVKFIVVAISGQHQVALQEAWSGFIKNLKVPGGLYVIIIAL